VSRSTAEGSVSYRHQQCAAACTRESSRASRQSKAASLVIPLQYQAPLVHDACRPLSIVGSRLGDFPETRGQSCLDDPLATLTPRIPVQPATTWRCPSKNPTLPLSIKTCFSPDRHTDHEFRPIAGIRSAIAAMCQPPYLDFWVTQCNFGCSITDYAGEHPRWGLYAWYAPSRVPIPALGIWDCLPGCTPAYHVWVA
jgi:hypothetical protein